MRNVLYLQCRGTWIVFSIPESTQSNYLRSGVSSANSKDSKQYMASFHSHINKRLDQAIYVYAYARPTFIHSSYLLPLFRCRCSDDWIFRTWTQPYCRFSVQVTQSDSRSPQQRAKDSDECFPETFSMSKPKLLKDSPQSCCQGSSVHKTSSVSFCCESHPARSSRC